MNIILDNIFAMLLDPIIASVSILVILTVYYVLKNKGLPPGPIGLPFVGYWPFMNDSNYHLKLNEMKKKYGDVFSFTVTGCLYINLGSLKAIRQAHVTRSDCFNERLSKFSLLSYSFDDGIGFIFGKQWENVRRFLQKSLKSHLAYSMKTNVIDSLYDSIKTTVTDLKAKKGKPVNLTEILIRKCNRTFRLILCGEFGVTEEEIREISELYVTELNFMTPMNMLLNGNVARYFIFPLMPGYQEFMKSHKLIEKLIYKIIDDHKATYNKEHIRDIIDEYIKERDTRREKGDSSARYFTDKTLMGTLVQYVGDGVLSLASFTGMLTKSLIQHPEEQEKIHEEIRDVVGLDRQPSIEDRNKLPYFNAFLHESIRTLDFFNVFPSLECTEETFLNGYRIPKGANTLLNFYCVHNDPEVYKQPEKFNPSRFIQVDDKQKEELPILFGVGKRSCLGEDFTMTQVFLFLTAIVQNFRLSYAENSMSPYEQFSNGKLFVCAQPRN